MTGFILKRIGTRGFYGKRGKIVASRQSAKMFFSLSNAYDFIVYKGWNIEEYDIQPIMCIHQIRGHKQRPVNVSKYRR